MRSLQESLRACHMWDEAISLQRQLIAMLPDQHLREEIALVRLLCSRTNSTTPAEEFLEKLSPVDLESPRVMQFRKTVANWKGDYAEFKRLDRLMPFFDGDGVEHVYQAVGYAQNYAAAGDMEGARARLDDYSAELRSKLGSEPANTRIIYTLAFAEVLLGHNEEAVRLARKASELLPLSRDAIDGGNVYAALIDVYAWTGDKEHALEVLERMMRVPNNTDVFRLRRDPMLKPLLGDPRFEALLDDPRNNQPVL